MKKIISLILGVLLLIPFVTSISASAEESNLAYFDLTDQLNKKFDEFGIEINVENANDLSFGDLICLIWNRLSNRISAPLSLLATILLLIFFSSILRSFSGSLVNGTNSNIYDLVCIVGAAAIVIPQIIDVYNDTLNNIELCGCFIVEFVPVFTTVAMISGGLISSGCYHLLILSASEMIVQLSERYFIPFLGITTALALTASAFPDSAIDEIVRLLKKISSCIIYFVITIYTGFVTLKCSIADKSDGISVKLTKSIMSSMIPIIGGAISEAYTTVKGSFEIIGGTFGLAGIIGIVLIMLPPIVEIFVYRGVLIVGAAAAELYSSPSFAKLLKSIDSGLAIAQSVLICYSLMLIISSAILTQSIGHG